MITRKTSRFVLGLFVTVGVCIGVVLLIWVGASRYFEEGDFYATYFDESVQGLQVDSSVKYRGVDVGRVVKIGVAPDNRLVEVILKIRKRGIVDEGTVSELKTAGITGIVFIELDRVESAEPVVGPKITFTPNYPVIPSRPSNIRQIRMGIAEIYEKIKAIDVEGITAEFKKTAYALESFFDNPEMKKTMYNLQEMSAALEKVAKGLEKKLAEGTLDEIIGEAQVVLRETRTTLSAMREEIDGFKMTERSAEISRLVDDLNRKTKQVSSRIDVLLRGLNENTVLLDRLLERLSNDPSELIFGGRVPDEE
ncbi:MAG: MlaD family protein [Syntrophales bacterium]|nr:MlaD family protein [Syntrophales bacterium]